MATRIPRPFFPGTALTISATCATTLFLEVPINPVSSRRVSQPVSILKSVAPRPTTPLISHTGQVLSRAVTFQFALDPNVEQKILLAKGAGARRFTVNHHLAPRL
jgi:hypothetical protein